jgi:prophage regulatory protein
MLRPAQVAGLLGVNRSTLWRWAREGRFPKPVKLSPGVVAWWLTDVREWQRQQAAGDNA